MHAKSLQSCLTLCDPMDCSLPGSSVHEILQARILEGVAMPSSRGSSQPRDRTRISFGSCTAGGFFTAEPWGKAYLATEFCASVSHLILDCLIRSPSLDTLCLICLLQTLSHLMTLHLLPHAVFAELASSFGFRLNATSSERLSLT